MHYLELELEKRALQLIELEMGSESVQSPLEQGDDPYGAWDKGKRDSRGGIPARACFGMPVDEQDEWLKGWASWHSLGD